MFSYGQLETAIRSLHDVPAERAATFKARIRHFQRIGLVPSSPGKGIKISYEVLDAVRWALCFELAELGLMPEVIKGVLYMCGRMLPDHFAGPAQAEDQIFWLRGEFLRWHFSPEHGFLVGRTMYGLVPVSQVVDVIFKDADAGRVLMLNLTKLKRDLGRALGIDWR